MLTVKLVLEKLDKEGKPLQRREQPCRSFVRNFMALLYVAHAQVPSSNPHNMTDVGGTTRPVDGSSGDIYGLYHYRKSNLKIGSLPGLGEMACLAGATNGGGIYPIGITIQGEKIGIQVGTGSTAPTPTDTAMVIRIAHGRNAGQLEYGGCELIGITFSEPTGEFTIRRYFTNASGGSITVNEVGLHAAGTQIGTAAWPFLIARDVVSPGITVADGEILRVIYVPQITV